MFPPEGRIIPALMEGYTASTLLRAIFSEPLGQCDPKS